MQTFFDPDHHKTTNYNFKFPMQNTVDMGSSSLVKTFNVASFSPIYLRHTGNGTSCGDPSDTHCDYQSIPYNIFEKFEYAAGSKVSETLNEPVTLEVN